MITANPVSKVLTKWYFFKAIILDWLLNCSVFVHFFALFSFYCDVIIFFMYLCFLYLKLEKLGEEVFFLWFLILKVNWTKETNVTNTYKSQTILSPITGKSSWKMNSAAVKVLNISQKDILMHAHLSIV